MTRELFLEGATIAIRAMAPWLLLIVLALCLCGLFTLLLKKDHPEDF